jgi:hypothetical protein
LSHFGVCVVLEEDKKQQPIIEEELRRPAEMKQKPKKKKSKARLDAEAMIQQNAQDALARQQNPNYVSPERNVSPPPLERAQARRDLFEKRKQGIVDSEGKFISHKKVDVDKLDELQGGKGEAEMNETMNGEYSSSNLMRNSGIIIVILAALFFVMRAVIRGNNRGNNGSIPFSTKSYSKHH